MSANPTEIIDLVSSSPEPEQQAQRSIAVSAVPALSQADQEILRLDPQASSARDAKGAYYPSPYTAIAPSILKHNAAKSNRGAPRLPWFVDPGHDKYTSTIEHELAEVKTKLAQANHKILTLEQQKTTLQYQLQAVKSQQMQHQQFQGHPLAVQPPWPYPMTPRVSAERQTLHSARHNIVPIHTESGFATGMDASTRLQAQQMAGNIQEQRMEMMD